MEEKEKKRGERRGGGRLTDSHWNRPPNKLLQTAAKACKLNSHKEGPMKTCHKYVKPINPIHPYSKFFKGNRNLLEYNLNFLRNESKRVIYRIK